MSVREIAYLQHRKLKELVKIQHDALRLPMDCLQQHGCLRGIDGECWPCDHAERIALEKNIAHEVSP